MVPRLPMTCGPERTRNTMLTASLRQSVSVAWLVMKIQRRRTDECELCDTSRRWWTSQKPQRRFHKPLGEFRTAVLTEPYRVDILTDLLGKRVDSFASANRSADWFWIRTVRSVGPMVFRGTSVAAIRFGIQPGQPSSQAGVTPEYKALAVDSVEGETWPRLARRSSLTHGTSRSRWLRWLSRSICSGLSFAGWHGSGHWAIAPT